MPYRIEFGRSVLKSMARLPREDQARIIVAVKRLAGDARPAGCSAIAKAPQGTYRIRIGDYRVVYVVLDREQTVVAARVARRNEGPYRGLA